MIIFLWLAKPWEHVWVKCLLVSLSIYLMFDSRYELPCRTYFSGTETDQIYNELYTIIQSELGGAEYFAGTTDMWTSRITDPYMSFTIHFITKDWELRTRSLQVSILLCLISASLLGLVVWIYESIFRRSASECSG